MRTDLQLTISPWQIISTQYIKFQLHTNKLSRLVRENVYVIRSVSSIFVADFSWLVKQSIKYALIFRLTVQRIQLSGLNRLFTLNSSWNGYWQGCILRARLTLSRARAELQTFRELSGSWWDRSRSKSILASFKNRDRVSSGFAMCFSFGDDVLRFSRVTVTGFTPLTPRQRSPKAHSSRQDACNAHLGRRKIIIPSHYSLTSRVQVWRNPDESLNKTIDPDVNCGNFTWKILCRSNFHSLFLHVKKYENSSVTLLFPRLHPTSRPK